MDGLQFTVEISKVVASLAWPVVTFVVLYVFRKEIVNLIPLIKKLKAGLLEIDFGEQVAKIEQETKALPDIEAPANQQLPNMAPLALDEVEILETTRSTSDNTLTTGSAKSDISRWHELTAGTRVMGAWSRLDEAVKRLAFEVAPAYVVARTTRYDKILIEHGAITPEVAEVLGNLYDLRNSVVHDGVNPTQSSSKRYAESAARMRDYLEGLIIQQTMKNQAEKNQP